MQQIRLDNGISIVNFSSPHPFHFITGEVLPACDADWVKKMSLDIEETETKLQTEPSRNVKNVKTWTDIELYISIPEVVENWIEKLTEDVRIDIVIVPFMMLQAMKDNNIFCVHKTNLSGLNTHKFRTIRVADRITKEIYSDRFCI